MASIYLNHHTRSGQSRVYRVTQLRSDGVRGSKSGKVVIANGSIESCEAIPIGPADESKESLCRHEMDRHLSSA